VAGVVLHGSLALGDYLPGRSDIDLLVVVDAGRMAAASSARRQPS
jgi:predicted nucleotidyltransferase